MKQYKNEETVGVDEIIGDFCGRESQEPLSPWACQPNPLPESWIAKTKLNVVVYQKYNSRHWKQIRGFLQWNFRQWFLTLLNLMGKS